MLTIYSPKVTRYATEHGITAVQALRILTKKQPSHRAEDLIDDTLSVAGGILLADAIESVFDGLSSSPDNDYSGGGGDFGGGGSDSGW